MPPGSGWGVTMARAREAGVSGTWGTESQEEQLDLKAGGTDISVHVG